MNHKTAFRQGMTDGIPIALGYMAVSFTFGIMAKNAGLTAFQAVLLSLTNLTSAGQFAGLGIITASASYIEMAFTQLVINLRYCLMSCALSQKLDQRTPFFHRFFIAYGNTDEIFGVCSCKEGKLNPFYSYGVIAVASPGWAFGTFLGIISGSILPGRVLSALGVALYGMFIAVIVPPSKSSRIIAGVVLMSMAASLIFTWLPLLNQISSGFRIILLTLLIAVPVGVVSAARQGSLLDRSLTVLVFLGFAMPSFWLALLLMLYFSIDLGWLPLSGLTSLNFATLSDTGKILDVARHLVLPILVGMVGGVAGTSRFLRSSMLEVLRQDYILTARAKGLPEHTVIFRHALRNALLPVITLLGLSVPGLIGGSVIIETIFALPGLGQLFYTAVMARDYPLIMGNLVLGATLTLLGNLLADLGYALADPRIRAGARSGGKGGGL